MSRARSRRDLALLMLAALLVPVAACAPQGEESAPPATPAASAAPGGATDPATGAEVPESVKKAAAIARAIQADPDSMDRILEDEGMTREDFEDLLYEIAADPVLSEAYVRELGS